MSSIPCALLTCKHTISDYFFLLAALHSFNHKTPKYLEDSSLSFLGYSDERLWRQFHAQMLPLILHVFPCQFESYELHVRFAVWVSILRIWKRDSRTLILNINFNYILKNRSYISTLLTNIIRLSSSEFAPQGPVDAWCPGEVSPKRCCFVSGLFLIAWDTWKIPWVQDLGVARGEWPGMKHVWKHWLWDAVLWQLFFFCFVNGTLDMSFFSCMCSV